MKKISIISYKSCILVFNENTTTQQICNKINELDFFRECLTEIENFSYLIETLELGETLIYGDNGFITVVYSIADEVIIYA